MGALAVELLYKKQKSYRNNASASGDEDLLRFLLAEWRLFLRPFNSLLEIVIVVTINHVDLQES